MVDHSGHLRAKDWLVRSIAFETARDLVETYHYARGGPNTGTYLLGLFRRTESVFESMCLGASQWLPPIVGAAKSVFPAHPEFVLSLSRLVIHPAVPKNGASFLLGQAMKQIDRHRWPVLLTYADTSRGHTGAIYRAANWKYLGLTRPERHYLLDGRLVSKKATNRNRSHAEMMALGCTVTKVVKHKFVHIAEVS